MEQLNQMRAIELKELREKIKSSRHQTAFNPNFKAYLNNIIISSLTTPFGRNISKNISISETDQLADTNRTNMEYLLLLMITIGSKELAIGSARLVDNIISEANQVRYYIGRWRKVD